MTKLGSSQGFRDRSTNENYYMKYIPLIEAKTRTT
jgi:hypothetical protein